MGMWIWMLVCNLLLPVIMLVAGKLFLKHNPGKINRIVGYRSAMSMKNEDTWQFAHEVAGKYWWKWGWISLPVAVVPMALLLGQPKETVATVGLLLMCLLMVPLIGVIPYTEKKLRNTFDKDGNRKPGIG